MTIKLVFDIGYRSIIVIRQSFIKEGLGAMSQEILLPKVGFSMSNATFVEWLVEDGSHVEAGQPLYSIENEKAIEEIPAPTSGIVIQKAVVDEEYDVGAVLGTIE